MDVRARGWSTLPTTAPARVVRTLTRPAGAVRRAAPRPTVRILRRDPATRTSCTASTRSLRRSPTGQWLKASAAANVAEKLARRRVVVAACLERKRERAMSDEEGDPDDAGSDEELQRLTVSARDKRILARSKRRACFYAKFAKTAEASPLLEVIVVGSAAGADY